MLRSGFCEQLSHKVTGKDIYIYKIKFMLGSLLTFALSRINIPALVFLYSRLDVYGALEEE